MFSYVLNYLSRFTFDLEMLESIILKRFQLYHSLDDLHWESESFYCYEKLAHILLSFVALDYPTFADCFILGESRLFMRKFETKSLSGKREELSELLVDLEFLNQSEEVKKFEHRSFTDRLKLIINSAEKLLENCCHVFHESHSEKCDEMKTTFPFTFLIDLVAKRKVVVSKGIVLIPCGKWYEILRVVYRSFVELELKLLKECEPLTEVIYELEDDRIRQVVKRFTNTLMGRVRAEKSGQYIKAADVDHLIQYFPPCMANLHQILRSTHRLSYKSRYQYSLFLKDIGLPVNENLLFWESEYSKPCQGSVCTHEWKDNQYRYKYQIQHMYGLIGNRDLKTSHSCRKFIEELLPKMNGGCPFQHWTFENLKNSIPAKIIEIPDVEDIFKYKKKSMPESACSAYLSCQLVLLSKRRNCSNTGFIPPIISPLQYYNLARAVVEN